MGRTAHCPARKRSLTSKALGDANRDVSGRLAGSNRESPPHRPPERRAFPRLGAPLAGGGGGAARHVPGRFGGSNGEAPPHRPPERRAFPRLGTSLAGGRRRGSAAPQE